MCCVGAMIVTSDFYTCTLKMSPTVCDVFVIASAIIRNAITCMCMQMIESCLEFMVLYHD